MWFVFIRAIGPKMKVFILRYFIVGFNFFLVLIFSVVGQRERQRSCVTKESLIPVAGHDRDRDREGLLQPNER